MLRRGGIASITILELLNRRLRCRKCMGYAFDHAHIYICDNNFLVSHAKRRKEKEQA